MRRLSGVGFIVAGVLGCGEPGAGAPVDAGGPSDMVADAPADTAHDAGAQPWGAGHGWHLSFQVVEAERGDVETAAQRLSGGLWLWLTADGRAWARLAGSTRVTGPIDPGYGPDGTMTIPVTADAGSYCAWTRVDATLVLRAADTDGDGGAPALTGTASGAADAEDFDVAGDPVDFEAIVTGAPDTEPATLYFSVAGRWPTQDVRLLSTEPVCEADLRAATTLTLDGQPAAFDLALSPEETGPPGSTPSKAGRPPGCGSRWSVLPGAPLAAGSTLAVSVAPVPDLVGNLSDVATLSHAVPPLPEPIAVPWDFSGGNPFVPQTGPEIVDAYGSVQAPSGGAMARAIFDVEDSARRSVAIPVLNQPSKAVVTLAIAGASTDIEAARPRLWIRTAAGEREATVTLAAPTALDGGPLASGAEGITPFAETSIGLAGLPAGVALLDIGLEGATWESCFGGPPWGAVSLLIDRIDVAPESAP